MFIKQLTISGKSGKIREINFRKGLNLIIDETPITDNKSTGNNVGKTTVLKLIDFCFGAKQSIIYSDEESKKEYTLVKDFLIEEEVLITLILIKDLDDETSNSVKIERNFLSRTNAIVKINGKKVTKTEYDENLVKILFPDLIGGKPSLRQIVSHNIRYSDYSVTHTLKTLNQFTSLSEYESLYLFLFNCRFNKGQERQTILSKIQQEDNFKKRLEKENTKNTYETMLDLIECDIERLSSQKSKIKVNPNFEADISNFNDIKYKLTKVSNEISRLEMRRNIIIESKDELESQQANIDIEQLEEIYKQAKLHIDNLQKTFKDLCAYHNKMLEEKLKFIGGELPELEGNIKKYKEELKILIVKEKELSHKIEISDSFEELEKLIFNLNEKFQKKGEYESKIEQIKGIEDTIKTYNASLDDIDADLFSEKFETLIKAQLKKFNKYFGEVSTELYGENERYAIRHEIAEDKKNNKIYKFISFNTNMSSGKKQGEISSFDLAYMKFADAENIPYLHFLLNDKKELMHDNQLTNISEVASKNNIQFIASILKDKLPSNLNKDENFIVKLSQTDKLFKIEQKD